ncbi:Putative Chromodomain Y-like protein 2 Short=CDY-like 2 [Rhizopus microsporus]|nr:Putative Chromodomain Y-like protein 2 Short=CDY-like 2 [Rhizopus microsporus]
MSQEADDETNYYEVEAILDKREFSTGVAEYLIKWKGYSEEHNTWEPEDNLNCPDILTAFNQGRINSREKNRETRKKTKTQKIKKEKRRKSASTSSSKKKSATIGGKRKASDVSSEVPKNDQGGNAQADSSKDTGIMHYTKVKRARHTQPKVAEVNIDAILKNIESNRALTTNQQASAERFKSTLYKNTTSSLASSSNNNLNMDKSKRR